MDYKQLSYPELQDWFSTVNFKTKPYQHQLASLAFTLGNNFDRVMLILDIGLGKTLISFYQLYLWNIKGKTLIICPNSVISTWKEEIEKHTDFSYCVLKGSQDERTQKILTEKVDIYIINYEGLKLIGADKIEKIDRDTEESIKVYKVNGTYAKNTGFECVIADECHHLKSPFSLQTRIAGLYSKWSLSFRASAMDSRSTK